MRGDQRLLRVIRVLGRKVQHIADVPKLGTGVRSDERLLRIARVFGRKMQHSSGTL